MYTNTDWHEGVYWFFSLKLDGLSAITGAYNEKNLTSYNFTEALALYTFISDWYTPV